MRPSLVEERVGPMLDALAVCIAEHGINATSTTLVAAEAGWSRGHVRHYLGNKTDQLKALADRLAQRYGDALRSLVDEAPEGSRRQVVLETLFGDPWQKERRQDDIVLDELIAFATANPDSGLSMLPMYERLVQATAFALESDGIETESQAANTAYSVVCLAYGNTTMAQIGWRDTNAARRTAANLLSLSDEKD